MLVGVADRTRLHETIVEELRVGDNPCPISEQCPPIIFSRDVVRPPIRSVATVLDF